MGILEEVCADEVLEIAIVETGAQFFEQVLVIEIRDGVAVIKPALHAADVVDEAFRRAAEIRLAELELIEVQRRLHQRAVEALVCEVLQRLHDEAAEFFSAVFFRVVDDDREERLHDIRLKFGIDVLAELRVNEHFA